MLDQAAFGNNALRYHSRSASVTFKG